ncbi:MAG: hypothetical protein ACI9DC_004089 [Gammaproteobacteria bacterium]|jgi:hypothetical protein
MQRLVLPPGFSVLMTSALKSRWICVASGAMIAMVKSRTLVPSKEPVLFLGVHIVPGVRLESACGYFVARSVHTLRAGKVALDGGQTLVFFMRRPLSEAALVHNRALLSLRLTTTLDFVARSERVHCTHQTHQKD